MKTRNNFLLAVVTLIILCVLTNCGNEGDPSQTEQDQAFEKLAGQWKLSNGGSIKLDGKDISLNYPGFALSFDNGTYETVNAGELFRANGVWDWTDGSLSSNITVDDGKEITIQGLSETDFIFSFNFSKGGTIAGVNGNYLIALKK